MTHPHTHTPPSYLQHLLPNRNSHCSICFLCKEVGKPSSQPLQRDDPMWPDALAFQKAAYRGVGLSLSFVSCSIALCFCFCVCTIVS